MEKEKRNKKLSAQIGLILLAVFTVMIGAVAFTTYNSTVSGFLKAQDAHMKTSLEDVYKLDKTLNDDLFGWCFDEWEKDPQEYHEPVTPEEEKEATEFINKAILVTDVSSADYAINYSSIISQSENIRNCYLKTYRRPC